MDWNFKNDQCTLKTKEMQVTIPWTSGADYSTIKEIPQKDVCVGPQNHTGKTMSMNISASKLLQPEVLLAYKTMLRPAMKYPLCSSTFSIDQCNQIDRSYLPTLLSRMGFNKTTKRLLFFGPPELGAYGITDTWTDQEIAQLQLLLGHLWQENEIAEALHIMIEQWQISQMVLVNLLFLSTWKVISAQTAQVPGSGHLNFACQQ